MVYLRTVDTASIAIGFLGREDKPLGSDKQDCLYSEYLFSSENHFYRVLDITSMLRLSDEHARG